MINIYELVFDKPLLNSNDYVIFHLYFSIKSYSEAGVNMAKNRVEVVIDGQIITLVSEEKEEHMQKLALYIDKKLSEIKSTKPNKPVTEHLRTLLISVNIADDYFKAVERRQVLEDTHQAYIHEMSRMQEENTLLTEKLHEMQAQFSHDREHRDKELSLLIEKANQADELQYKLDAVAESINHADEMQSEIARLTEENQNLQEQLKIVRAELDEYISTFEERRSEDRKNVVNFGSGTGR